MSAAAQAGASSLGDLKAAADFTPARKLLRKLQSLRVAAIARVREQKVRKYLWYDGVVPWLV
jgi:hypothetical protein